MLSRRRPLVLIVDDCDCLRAAFKTVLREMAGIHAVGAATSEQALKLAQHRHFDAVINDIVRPGMDGLTFLEVFKRAYPTAPVVIASGNLDEATARKAKRLRAFDCLPKPFSCHELVEAVRAAIASRKVCRTALRLCRSSRWD